MIKDDDSWSVKSAMANSNETSQPIIGPDQLATPHYVIKFGGSPEPFTFWISASHKPSVYVVFFSFLQSGKVFKSFHRQ
jgi:hypothetical protein